MNTLLGAIVTHEDDTEIILTTILGDKVYMSKKKINQGSDNVCDECGSKRFNREGCCLDCLLEIELRESDG